ncbi:hypothetical protein ACRDNQ_03680 [Palleronia sp. KMU-117]
MADKEDDPDDIQARRDADARTPRDKVAPRRDPQDAPKAPPAYRDWASI